MVNPDHMTRSAIQAVWARLDDYDSQMWKLSKVHPFGINLYTSPKIPSEVIGIATQDGNIVWVNVKER